MAADRHAEGCAGAHVQHTALSSGPPPLPPCRQVHCRRSGGTVCHRSLSSVMMSLGTPGLAPPGSAVVGGSRLGCGCGAWGGGAAAGGCPTAGAGSLAPAAAAAGAAAALAPIHGGGGRAGTDGLGGRRGDVLPAVGRPAPAPVPIAAAAAAGGGALAPGALEALLALLGAPTAAPAPAAAPAPCACCCWRELLPDSAAAPPAEEGAERTPPGTPWRGTDASSCGPAGAAAGRAACGGGPAAAGVGCRRAGAAADGVQEGAAAAAAATAGCCCGAGAAGGRPMAGGCGTCCGLSPSSSSESEIMTLRFCFLEAGPAAGAASPAGAACDPVPPAGSGGRLCPAVVVGSAGGTASRGELLVMVLPGALPPLPCRARCFCCRLLPLLPWAEGPSLALVPRCCCCWWPSPAAGPAPPSASECFGPLLPVAVPWPWPWPCTPAAGSALAAGSKAIWLLLASMVNPLGSWPHSYMPAGRSASVPAQGGRGHRAVHAWGHALCGSTPMGWHTGPSNASSAPASQQRGAPCRLHDGWQHPGKSLMAPACLLPMPHSWPAFLARAAHPRAPSKAAASPHPPTHPRTHPPAACSCA